MLNKVAMVSLGCPKNQVDAEQMLFSLKEVGFSFTEEAEADVIIINTCAFIEDAKKEAIENILEAAEYKKSGKCKLLVVTGCLAERYQNDVTEEIPEVDIAVGIGSNKNIAEIIKAGLDGKKENSFGSKLNLDLNGERILGGFPYTAYLKVADGCDNCCTYCAIPKIRGKFRSRTIEDCVKEAESLAERGVTELIVVAQDTTAYGTDIYGKPMLSSLLKELAKIEKLHWIRTLYTYIDKIDDDLIETVANNEKLVKYFDIPLQHIDSAVLKRMNRKGSEESIRKVIEKIRKKIPNVVLRTTFITGFPGESEEQFSALHSFVKEIKFNKLGCFPYSKEEDTVAYGYSDQVDEQTKLDRAELIMNDQMTISALYNEAEIGSVKEVLVEGYDDYIKCYYGRSRNDAPEIDGKVFFFAKRPLVFGEYVFVKINDCLDYDLLGEQEDEFTE